MLVTEGMDANKADSRGDTPLRYAVVRRQDEAAAFLVEEAGVH